MGTPKTPDWLLIEKEYCAGIKPLRQIAAEHGITHGAVNKRAKRDGWARDLAGKIAARTGVPVALADSDLDAMAMRARLA